MVDIPLLEGVDVPAIGVPSAADPVEVVDVFGVPIPGGGLGVVFGCKGRAHALVVGALPPLEAVVVDSKLRILSHGIIVNKPKENRNKRVFNHASDIERWMNDKMLSRMPKKNYRYNPNESSNQTSPVKWMDSWSDIKTDR